MELREALKEKVHNAFAEQRFVGEVRYSENEYRELLDYTSEFSRFFANGIGSNLRGDDEIHFTTLVEIAKRWKNDEDNDTGYWRYVLITIRGGATYDRSYF